MNNYIVQAGCSLYAEHYPVYGKLENVERWAYQTAVEEFDSYAGNHGLMDYADFCHDMGYDDPEDEEALADFEGYREEELVYSVEPFDETKAEHLYVLEWNKGEFIEV